MFVFRRVKTVCNKYTRRRFFVVQWGTLDSFGTIPSSPSPTRPPSQDSRLYIYILYFKTIIVLYILLSRFFHRNSKTTIVLFALYERAAAVSVAAQVYKTYKSTFYALPPIEKKIKRTLFDPSGGRHIRIFIVGAAAAVIFHFGGWNRGLSLARGYDNRWRTTPRVFIYLYIYA